MLAPPLTEEDPRPGTTGYLPLALHMWLQLNRMRNSKWQAWASAPVHLTCLTPKVRPLTSGPSSLIVKVIWHLKKKKKFKLGRSRALNSLYFYAGENYPETVWASEHMKRGSMGKEAFPWASASELSVSPDWEWFGCFTSPTGYVHISIFIFSSHPFPRPVRHGAGCQLGLNSPWLSSLQAPCGPTEAAFWAGRPLALPLKRKYL